MPDSAPVMRHNLDLNTDTMPLHLATAGRQIYTAIRAIKHLNYCNMLLETRSSIGDDNNNNNELISRCVLETDDRVTHLLATESLSGPICVVAIESRDSLQLKLHISREDRTIDLALPPPVYSVGWLQEQLRLVMYSQRLYAFLGGKVLMYELASLCEGKSNAHAREYVIFAPQLCTTSRLPTAALRIERDTLVCLTNLQPGWRLDVLSLDTLSPLSSLSSASSGSGLFRQRCVTSDALCASFTAAAVFFYCHHPGDTALGRWRYGSAVEIRIGSHTADTWVLQFNSL